MIVYKVLRCHYCWYKLLDLVNYKLMKTILTYPGVGRRADADAEVCDEAPRGQVQVPRLQRRRPGRRRRDTPPSSM